MSFVIFPDLMIAHIREELKQQMSISTRSIGPTNYNMYIRLLAEAGRINLGSRMIESQPIIHNCHVNIVEEVRRSRDHVIVSIYRATAEPRFVMINGYLINVTLLLHCNKVHSVKARCSCKLAQSDLEAYSTCRRLPNIVRSFGMTSMSSLDNSRLRFLYSWITNNFDNFNRN